MKNKILSYLLGCLLVLSMGFITSYTNAQGDVNQCRTNCSIQYGTDPRVNDCYSECKSTTTKDTTAEEKCPNGCCGVKLNTKFPIIGDCIKTSKGSGTDATQAFPSMIGALTKIIMSIILVVCFILIIVAGIMRSANKPKEAKGLLTKVAITILLLGFSGVILKLINPNFFG